MSGRRPIPIPVEPGRPRGALFLPGFYAWRILGPSGPFYFLPCLTHSCTPKTSTISPQCARRHSVNPARIPDARRIGAAAPGLTRPACYRPPWRLLWEGLACPGRDQSADRARFAWPGHRIPAKSCEIGFQAPKCIRFGPGSGCMG